MTAGIHNAWAGFLRASMLLLLVEGPKHGYELLTEMADRGYGDPDAGGVYRALRAMEEERLVVSSWESGRSGPARRIYAITDEGRHRLEEYVAGVRDQRRRLNRFLRDYQTVRTAPL